MLTIQTVLSHWQSYPTGKKKKKNIVKAISWIFGQIGQCRKQNYIYFIFAICFDVLSYVEIWLYFQIETVSDPVVPVEAILKRCNKQSVMLHYTIPNFSNVQEFLSLVAKRFGKLKKGGVGDVESAAKMVLQDWNRWEYCTLNVDVTKNDIISVYSKCKNCTSNANSKDIESNYFDALHQFSYFVFGGIYFDSLSF